MNLNCTLCQSSLEIGESGKTVFCKFCDRGPDNLVGLLDAIKKKKDKISWKYDQDIERFIEERTKEIEKNIQEAIDEVTIQYHCIRCERPTNQYGFCLWCEDELRETL